MTTVVLVIIGFLLAALVAAFWLRRRFLLSGLGAVEMWLRPAGVSRWSVGGAWYSGDTGTGNFTDRWYGGIDDVSVYQGAMNAAQVAILHDQQATPEAA